MKKCIILLSLAFLGVQAGAQTRYYVNANAQGANNGLSWPNAWVHLQTALQSAQAGDTIWVAAGTYKPTTDNNRDSSFKVPSGIAMYGGFTGTETQLNQRNWATNETLLSGDIGAPGDSLDNSFTIMYMDNPDSLTLVDGFVFRYGAAINPTGGLSDGPQRSGGALYIQAAGGEAYAVFRNNRFEYNSALRFGGAVYINGEDLGSIAPQFLNCTFARNRAVLDGGAVVRRGSSWIERIPDFGDCTFDYNTSGRWGGAIFYDETEMLDTFHVTGCTFTRNQGDIAAGIAGSIGRISGSKVAIRNNTFTENEAGGTLGTSIGLINTFNALDYSYIDIRDCIFIDEKPGTSIIHLELFGKDSTSTIYIDNCIFNSSDHFTNTILTESPIYGNVLVDNNTFLALNVSTIFRFIQAEKIEVGNSTIVNYKANIFYVFQCKNFSIKNIYIKNSDLESAASTPIVLNGTNATINNCTYDNNRFLIVVDEKQGISNVKIRNSAIRTSELFNNFWKTITSINIDIDDCWIDTTYLKCADFPPNFVCGPNNIYSSDPMFKDTANNDYTLQPCSPLINAGNNLWAAGNPVDLAGNPRIRGSAVDIGAYESAGTQFAQPALVAPACREDSTGAIRVFPAGCAPYAYKWSDGNTDSLRTGLLPGTYVLTLTDGKGEVLIDTISILSSAPTVSISGDTLLCGTGTTGELTALPSGLLQTPITFLWNTNDMDPTISGLTTGLYTVTLTDAIGCADSAQASLTVVDAPESNSTVTNATHVDSLNGRIDFVITSGVGPYTYVWDTGDSTASISGLAQGTYAMLLTDGAGCTYGYVFDVGVSSSTVNPGTNMAGRVWPNPLGDVLHIEWGTADTWLLFDALGRQVAQAGAGSGQTTVSTRKLAAGTYTSVFFRNTEAIARALLLKS